MTFSTLKHQKLLVTRDKPGNTLPSGGPLATWESYVSRLAPAIWYRLRETAGTSPVNSGSASLTATWTAGAGALGQTGKLGANEAYDFDALVSKIVIADNAAIQALSTYSIIALVYADGYGENNLGTALHLGASLNMRFTISGASGSFYMGFDTDGTDAASTTNTGFFALSAWHLMFGTYDDAGDRKAYIYKGINGAVTAATYTGQTAATGTRVAPVAAQIGNFADARTWDGKIDEVIVVASVLSAAQMATLTTLAGV